jgi:PEP-CTERM motif-containing protein
MNKALSPLVALGLLSINASAQVMFDQSYTTSNGDNGAFSHDPGQQIADNFSPSFSGTVGTARWWGNDYQRGNPYTTSTTFSFSIRFYNDAGGAPGLSPFSTSSVTAALTDTGTSFSGDRIYQYDVNFAGPSLTATVPYYFQVVTTDSRLLSDWRWNNYSFANAGSRSWYRGDNASAWLVDPGVPRGDHAFVLYAVPEPTSLFVLSGLAVAALKRRKK